MHTELLFNQRIIKENNLMTRVLNIEELTELSEKDEVKFHDKANKKFESWKENISSQVNNKFNGNDKDS